MAMRDMGTITFDEAAQLQVGEQVSFTYGLGSQQVATVQSVCENSRGGKAVYVENDDGKSFCLHVDNCLSVFQK